MLLLCLPAVHPGIIFVTNVRHLSRLRTKTPRKIYWFRSLPPPLFDKAAIEKKLEERPEARFEKIAPALVSQSSSVFYDELLNAWISVLVCLQGKDGRYLLSTSLVLSTLFDYMSGEWEERGMGATKFTNMVMMEARKRVAEKIVRSAFEIIKRQQLTKYLKADDEEKPKIVISPIKIFHDALNNCKPVLRLTPLKRGGITYQVPAAVSDAKAEWTSMKWIILASRDKPQDEYAAVALAREILNAFNNEGRVIKRKYDLHKQCEANKAYAHYRWSR